MANGTSQERLLLLYFFCGLVTLCPGALRKHVPKPRNSSVMKTTTINSDMDVQIKLLRPGDIPDHPVIKPTSNYSINIIAVEDDLWKTKVIIICTVAASVEVFIVVLIVIFWKRIRWTLRKINCPCDRRRRHSEQHEAMEREEQGQPDTVAADGSEDVADNREVQTFSVPTNQVETASMPTDQLDTDSGTTDQVEAAAPSTSQRETFGPTHEGGSTSVSTHAGRSTSVPTHKKESTSVPTETGRSTSVPAQQPFLDDPDAITVETTTV